MRRWNAAHFQSIAARCRTISARYPFGKLVRDCKLAGDNRARPGETPGVCEQTHNAENCAKNDQLGPRGRLIVVPLYHPQQAQYGLRNADRPYRPVEISAFVTLVSCRGHHTREPSGKAEDDY